MFNERQNTGVNGGLFGVKVRLDVIARDPFFSFLTSNFACTSSMSIAPTAGVHPFDTKVFRVL